MEIGNRIKEIRKNQHLTQMELAVKIGMTRAGLAKIENSKTGNMTVYTAARIAKALGVSLDFLCCGEC